MYQINRTGNKVVKDFQRLCQTGDVAKITPGLYHHLILYGGFIAHYSIHGFRDHYRGAVSALLDGESGSLYDSWVWEARTHLKDSAYTDGMTAYDVMRDICKIAQTARPVVTKREDEKRRAAHIALGQAIANEYDVTLTPIPGGCDTSCPPGCAAAVTPALASKAERLDRAAAYRREAAKRQEATQ